MRAALLGLLLAGCAAFDVQWRVDMPDYRMQKLEWHVLHSARAVANRCGLDAPRPACSIRIREGGQCLVYSIYTQEQAKNVRALEGGSVYTHEVDEHCGGGTKPGMTHVGAGND